MKGALRLMTKRERRWAKKKEKPRRTEAGTGQPDLFAGVTGERRIGNGTHCQVRGERIDTANCIVQQTREPGKCFGCGQFRD